MNHHRRISVTNARSLRRLVASVLAMCAASTVCAVVVVGCGSSAAGTTGGADAVCRAVDGGVTRPACGSWTVDVVGDPSTCGFDSGALGRTDCVKFCGSPVDQCSISGAKVTCDYFCTVDGRRPEALSGEPSSDARDLGEHFGLAAFHEAASVDAFVAIERDLRAHGAPASLLATARRAARDERRHAAMAARLARRFGGKAKRCALGAPAMRSIEAMAMENAREGCGRELLGVLLGSMQASRATDRTVRRFLTRIVVDESRHAAFSFRLHAWLFSRLSRRAQRRVRREVIDAFAVMRLPRVSPAMRGALGLPTEQTFADAKRALLPIVRRSIG